MRILCNYVFHIIMQNYIMNGHYCRDVPQNEDNNERLAEEVDLIDEGDTEDDIQVAENFEDHSDIEWDARSEYEDAVEDFIPSDDDENLGNNEDIEINEDDMINRQQEADDEADFHNNRPLYTDSPISVGESMLLILMILLRHNVTYECLSDIISVINMHCPQRNLQKITLNKFKNFFSLDSAALIKHYYCSKCLKMFNNIDDVCEDCVNSVRSYFVQLPFIAQLEEMFKRNDFYLNLQKRFDRPRHPPGVLADMYDASFYSEWVDNDFLNNPNNLSFTWYTDGIPVYKASNTQHGHFTQQ